MSCTFESLSNFLLTCNESLIKMPLQSAIELMYIAFLNGNENILEMKILLCVCSCCNQ